MKIIEGKYTSAIVYSDTAEDSALGQVQALCDQPFTKDSKIRLMPDIHAGKGCTIGTTMTYTDKICPNIVGVDISCGMLVVQLKENRVNLPELDSCIRKISQQVIDKLGRRPINLLEIRESRNLSGILGITCIVRGLYPRLERGITS